MDITDRRIDPRPAAGKLRLINESNVARLLDSNGRKYRLRPEPGTPVNGVKASGTITFTGLPATGVDGIIVNSLNYGFMEVAASGVEIAIGADVTEMAANTAAAINARDPLVTATSALGVVTVTAATAGASGNSIGLTEGAENTAVSGSGFLTGGVSATPASAGDEMYDATHKHTAITDVLPSSTTGWKKVAWA